MSIDIPIALSGGAITETPFSAATRSSIIEGLAGALYAVGWTKTPITGGYRCVGTSPQGLSVGVDIWDNGRTYGTPYPIGNQASIQFRGSGEIVGTEFRLAARDGYTYRVIAGQCQFFVGLEGFRRDYSGTGDLHWLMLGGSSVMGGVPWVPATECGGNTVADAASEAWWAMGESNSSSASSPPAATLRTSLIMYTTPLNHILPYTTPFRRGEIAEACWNGTYLPPLTVDGGTVDGLDDSVGWLWPSIPSLAYTNENLHFNADTLSAALPTAAMWASTWDTGRPHVTAPWLAWSTDTTSTARIRGQIWDAICLGRPKGADQTENGEPWFAQSGHDDYPWRNFTDRCVFGSLWLIRGPATTRVTHYFAY
jgi:hypothetical protein